MYDKVKLILRGAMVVEQFHNLSPRLTDATESIKVNTGEVIGYGYLDGLKLSLRGDSLWIEGSLAKYLNGGSNIYSLNINTTRQAIEKISDSLKLDIGQAKVTSLEFGANFSMNHKASDYIRLLGDCPRLNRVCLNNKTLYYKTNGKSNSRVIIFYDKVAETLANGLKCPDNLTNLLRYEIRYNHRLPKQLGVAEVTASTLYESEFYERMLKLYKDTYFSISRQKLMDKDNMKGVKTVGGACNLLLARYINQGDKNVVSQFIEDLKQERVFANPSEYSRLRNRLKDIANMACCEASSELIQELDNAIKNCVADS